MLLPSELDDAQRAVARALAFARGVALERFALPAQARARRRWLGIGPPGVLEEEVAPGLPRWLAYRRLLEARKDDELGTDLDAAPARKIEALVEVSLGSYDLHSVAATSPLGTLIDRHAADLVAYAKRLGPELVALFVGRAPPDRRLGDVGPRAVNDFHWFDEAAAAAAVLPLVVTGQPYDASVARLASFSGLLVERHADLVAWFPEVERDELATAAARRSNVFAVPTGCAILARFVLPGIAAWMVERYGGGKADGQTPPTYRDAWKKEIEALARARPAVAPLVAAALTPAVRKELKLAAPKRAARAPKWEPPQKGASIEARVASFEQAIAQKSKYPERAFIKLLDELLLDVFGRAWRPLPFRRPASLTDVERRTLTVYTDYGVAMYPHLTHAGLPQLREPTRRLLGLASPALDDALVLVNGEELPVRCAAADAVFGGASLEPIVRAIAALPDAAKIFVEYASVRGSITWAPLAPTRREITGFAPMPSHGPAFVRFLGALGAASGPEAASFSKKRLVAQMESAQRQPGHVLVDLVVLARLGDFAPPFDEGRAIVESECAPELVACLREVVPSRVG